MENFQFSAQPHAAPVKMARQKYRDQREDEVPLNLMQDPRVFRGNTYSAQVVTATSKKEQQLFSKTDRPVLMKKNRKFKGKRGSSPPPVEGRVHMDIQTDNFLEELTDRPIEIDATTQTLPELDRPSSPLFIPTKIGKDIETQIVAGDLFDFDIEVEPLLELLVGKTIHVSMLELMQEEELEAIRRQQDEFESIRNVELAEVQRLEGEARRKAEEKQRRIDQEKKRLQDRRELEEKVAARAFASQYLGSLHNEVFETLENEGFFFDPVRREVEDIFMADVISDLNLKANAYDAAQKLADDLIEASRKRAKAFEAEAIRIRNEIKEKLRQEELERQRLKAEEEARIAAEAAAAAAALESEETPAEE